MLKIIKGLNIFVLTALACTLSFSSILANNTNEPLEIFKIAGDFSVATNNGTNSDEFKKLVEEGWDIQHDSYGVDTSFAADLCLQQGFQYEIEKPFLDRNKIKNAVYTFNNYSQYSDKGALMAQTETDNEFIVDLCNEMALKYVDSMPPIEQHFVYNVAEKYVNGKKVYVISFRGTPDQYSWIFTDFMAFPIDFLDTNLQVHAGFEWNRQACNSREILSNFLKKIESDTSDYTLIIVGHSMGAAVALLETAYLYEKNNINTENLYLISLAEPCPGKANFAVKYETLLKNYYWPCNLYDIVPIAPMIVGYVHFYAPGYRLFNLGPVPTLIPYSNDRHNINYYRDFLYDPQI